MRTPDYSRYLREYIADDEISDNVTYVQAVVVVAAAVTELERGY